MNHLTGLSLVHWIIVAFVVLLLFTNRLPRVMRSLADACWNAEGRDPWANSQELKTVPARLRFSLRNLLLSVTLAGVGVGLFLVPFQNPEWSSTHEEWAMLCLMAPGVTCGAAVALLLNQSWALGALYGCGAWTLFGLIALAK